MCTCKLVKTMTYELRSWAKWHPSNRDMTEPPSLEEFLDEEEGALDADEEHPASDDGSNDAGGVTEL